MDHLNAKKIDLFKASLVERLEGLLLIILSLSCITAFGQHDSLSTNSVKQTLQGVWTSPNGTAYFLFKGDSVKEWEDEGADSSLKPFCSYTVSRTACDSISAHVTGTTGFFLEVTCGSEDYQQIRCYYILSLDADDIKLGFRGEFDPDSGEFKKVKSKM